MERVVNVAESHEEADQHDDRQNSAKTPDDRIDDYIELRQRIYGKDNPDIREYERAVSD